jgi:hypothetical protein
MRLRQTELMILIWGAKGGEIRQKDNLVQIVLRSVTTTRNHQKEDSMVGCKITRSIAFGSLVANSYAQFNSITSEPEKSNNNVTSALTTCNSQKIPIWCSLI